jgi:hypothetical protein
LAQMVPAQALGFLLFSVMVLTLKQQPALDSQLFLPFHSKIICEAASLDLPDNYFLILT